MPVAPKKSFKRYCSVTVTPGQPRHCPFGPIYVIAHARNKLKKRMHVESLPKSISSSQMNKKQQIPMKTGNGYSQLAICCVVMFLWLMVSSLWMSDLQNVLSSTALLSSYSLKPVVSFRRSVSLIFGLPLFLLPSTFPSIIIFSRESSVFMIYPK